MYESSRYGILVMHFFLCVMVCIVLILLNLAELYCMLKVGGGGAFSVPERQIATWLNQVGIS